MNTKYLISIVGPTAIGKTALSIALARHFKTEILSADSRQFYRELQIGTAAPSPEELKMAPHYFVHHKSVVDDYNVGAFERDALQLLEQLFQQQDVVIMVGGSGLYVDAVTKGLDNFPDIEPSVRVALNEQLVSKGLEFLQERLKELDPVSYDSIALDNPHRVIRALEISIGSGGLPYSSYLNQQKDQRPFKTITVGLTAERSIIYERINQRVDQMIASGLLEEVENLKKFKKLNALNTVGYSELFKFIDKEWSLDFAISEIKKNSRRYAKRQLTWLRKKENICWFDYQSSMDEIIKTINKEMK